MKQQHRYYNGRSMFIRLKGLTVIAEVREGRKIIESHERTFTTEKRAERMYKEACKTLFPAFTHDYLVLTSEQLAEDNRR